ncbi:MAG TPA: glycosyltransferase family 4 protein [Solirubrobacteraceae bacterium]|jgi:glycosyltransferase involved in cell wall biosynthesis|nr:glycosyltransferase family 4 protein [Solirubrobacteraceae bacterium]
MISPSTLRVAVADVLDPADVHAGSGASASLLKALKEVVAEAVPLSGELPPRLGRLAHLSSVASRMRPRDLHDPRAAAKRVHGAAALGRPTIAARNRLMRRHLAAAGALDGVVQRCADMLLPVGCRIVTLEDSTVVQALEAYPWAHLQALSEREIHRYVERQRQIYEAAVACCGATHWASESIVKDYGIPAERVHTVGLGQNHELSDEPTPRDWSEPRYLFVGRRWLHKNGPVVLAAFARVRERHPKARFDVVGDHPRLDAPGVVGHGLFSLSDPGDQERLAALYRSATVFAMPSLHEAAGIVYVEAGGAGVPSIGTTNGGTATMIGDGGVVVDPLDAEQIFAAMLRLADPETAQRMGAIAYRHSRLFTWRKVAERLIRALAIPGLDTSGLADYL